MKPTTALFCALTTLFFSTTAFALDVHVTPDRSTLPQEFP